jgi:hypothetical protein
MISVEQAHQKIIVAARTATGEADYEKALVEIGMSENEARNAFRFTQIAWARSILGRLGINLLDDYVIFDAAGKIAERGKLSGQTWFVAAARDAGKYQALPEFQKIVAGSSEFDAVNKALNSGSKAEGLMMTPVFLFAPDMSEKAVYAAHLVVATEIERLKAQARAQKKGAPEFKPWWKIW